MEESPSNPDHQQLMPHLHTLQTLNQSTDVNFSIESIFATEEQMPQLSFMTDNSDTMTNSSSHTLCESLEDQNNHDISSGLLVKSKALPPPKLDFSSFNITDELPTCTDKSKAGLCCKNNVLPEVLPEINTPNPVRIENYNDNPFDMIQSQAVQMAIASEVEMPAPWVDVTVLATKAVIPTSVAPDTNCLALPTGIPSYVDLPYQVSTATTSTSMQMVESVGPSLHATNQLSINNSLINVDEVMTEQEHGNQQIPEIREMSNSSDDLDVNIVDTLLSEANHMYNNPHIQTTAQQIEADTILSEILRSIDNVHQTTAQMAKEAAARQSNRRPASVLPQLTNLSAMFGPSPSSTPTPTPSATSLETITAEADICSCGSNCMCDQNLGCQGGCGPLNPCRALPAPSIEMDIDSASKPSGGGCCGGDSCGNNLPKPKGRLPNKRNPPIAAVRPKSLNSLEAQNLISTLVTSACCTTAGSEKSHIPPKPSCASSSGGGCTCKSPMEGIANGCCVVICLKTLEQLRSLLNSSTINLIRCSGGGGVT